MDRRTLHVAAAAVLVMLLAAGLGLMYYLGFWGELVYGFLLWVALAAGVDLLLFKAFVAYLKANPAFYWLAVFLITITGLALVATLIGADIGVIELVIAAGMVVASLKKK